MGYNSDMIIADTEEMAHFLNTAVVIKRELTNQINDIERKYRAITNWDDNIHEKVGATLDNIDKKCEVVFDEIDRLNRALGEYLDRLNDYNDPRSGRMGRF